MSVLNQILQFYDLCKFAVIRVICVFLAFDTSSFLRGRIFLLEIFQPTKVKKNFTSKKPESIQTFARQTDV